MRKKDGQGHGPVFTEDLYYKKWKCEEYFYDFYKIKKIASTVVLY